MTQVDNNKLYMQQQAGYYNPTGSLPLQNRPAQAVRIPEIYSYDPENKSSKKAFKDTIIGSMIYMMAEPIIEHPLLFGGTFLGACWGADKVAENFGGQYEKSWLGKIAKAGDKFEQSAIVQNDVSQSILKFIKKTGSTIDKAVSNTQMGRAIKTTPCLPEMKMAKHEILPIDQRVVKEEFSIIVENLRLNDSRPIEFQMVKPDKADKEMLKKFFGVDSISKISKEDATHTVLLKRLGRSDAEVRKILNLGDNARQMTKNEIIKEMGLTSEQLQKIIKDEACQHTDEVFKAVEKGRGKIKVAAGYFKQLGPIQPFVRQVSCDQVYNRLHSISGGAKTATGRFLSTATQRLHRCLTFGGGKIGILIFIAPHLVNTILNTKKADKDRKVGTAVGDTLGMGLWMIAMPMAARAIYSVAGVKYSGMSEDQVKEYRRLINEFNAKTVLSNINENGEKVANPNAFKNVAEYNAERAILESKLKSLKKVKDQNLLTKAVRKVTSILTCDLEQIKPFKNKNMIANSIRSLGYNTKNFINVPLRAIAFFVLQGKIEEVILKGVSLVFGKSYNAEAAEARTEGKKEQKLFTKKDLQQRMLDAQKNKIAKVNDRVDLTEQQKIMSAMAADIESKSPKTPTKEQIIAKTPNQEVKTFKDVKSSQDIQSNQELETLMQKQEEQKISKTDENIESSVENNIVQKNEQVIKEDLEKEITNQEQQVKSAEPTEELETFEQTSADKNAEPEVVVLPPEAVQKVDNKSFEKPKGEPLYSQIQPVKSNMQQNIAQNQIYKMKQPVDNYSYIPSQNSGVIASKKIKNNNDNYSYLPSQDNVLGKPQEANISKYIPSQIASQFTKTFDNSGLESALRRADKAEKKAIEVLNGNFNHI
ncbi:MAG: hypothetical protein E7Z89_05440 [Cyanobacteria bacterium SIG28]|nr:hypothetical protein [Cyanobacteria bacterium SIG28]